MKQLAPIGQKQYERFVNVMPHTRTHTVLNEPVIKQYAFPF